MNSVSASRVDTDNGGNLDLFVSNASISSENYLYSNLLKETGKINTEYSNQINGPHQGQPVIHAGAPLKHAKAAMIMLHGRGADAHDILTLVPELNQREFAYFAPNAAGNTWYPYSFLAPISQNEPGISSGLQAISETLEQLNESGFPSERVMLLGFSQGACLTLEFVARNARRYGGVAGLSGGLIGPEDTSRDYGGSLDSTPVFLGCSDIDPHIPQKRVRETTKVLKQLGGDVTERLYSNMGHTINRDEIRHVQEIMRSLINQWG